jgi:hypothetical protein
MAYSSPAPGNANAQVVLQLNVIGAASPAAVITGDPATAIAMGTALNVPALQDVTINAANDVFTWSQLDSSAKLQVATTSTNNISMNCVVDPASFFGTDLVAASTDTAAEQGLLGFSRNKTRVAFALRFLDGGPTGGDGSSTTTNDRWIKGVGYITGLAPTVSADSPVWVTPVTITVTGEYLVAATVTT